MSKLKLMFVGDISLGEHYFSFGHGPKTTAKSNDIFSSVKEVFKEADFVCGNLEGPISDIGLDPREPESVVFRGEPRVASELSDAGFNLMHIANNHIIQHGKEAYHHTLQLLRSNNIIPLGNKGDDCIIEKNGIKIAIISASSVPDNTDKTQGLYNTLNTAEIVEKVANLKGQVDWIVASLHWGLEEKVEPIAEQIEIAKSLKAAGVNFIIGHHPHIFYPVDAQENYLCAWSLGNFVFDLPWDERLCRSAVLEITLDKTSYKALLHPVKILPNGMPLLSGEPQQIGYGRFSLYKNSENFSFFGFKKLAFFIKNSLNGDTHLKFTFFKRKILNKLSPAGAGK